MGIDYNLLQFIQGAPPLGDVLTLGHQEIMVRDKRLKRLGLPTGEKYSDRLLRALGAKSVRALDVSGFEAADFIHDLNNATNCRESFDTIIDGGTLEHIFNLPQALGNVMNLLRLNGRLIIDSPTNNWCGHGFYQPSPELFFGALNRVNGFVIEHCVIHRVGSSKWYEVLNPLETGRRSELMSFWPMTLKVMARRIEIVEPFSHGWPQQSDYVTRWANSREPKPYHKIPFSRHRPWWSPIRTAFAFWGMSVRNRKCFKRLNQ